MYLTADSYVGRSLELYGEYSEGEVGVFTQLVRPGMVVLDIGANIGAHTLVLSQAVGPAGRVLAFEPQLQIYHLLCGNIALNSLGNVVAHHAALGRERRVVNVPRLDLAAANNFGGVGLAAMSAAAGAGDPTPMFTLDSLELGACHFIKIDVEGMERQVLEGGTMTLQRHRPILYVENDRDAESPALVRFLLDCRYRLYWHLVPLFNPQNHLGAATNVFGIEGSISMLCIPNDLPTVGGLREIMSPQDSWR